MTASEEEVQLLVNKSVALFGVPAPDSLVHYLTAVLEWNAVLGLVSRKDPVAACERLLMESIELGHLLDVGHSGRVADVGSGAGFPGLVWALLYPHVEIVLVERREKRALFLERTGRTLGAANVTILAKDLRDVPRETGPFDLVTAVAVGDPADIAGHVESLLTEGGRFASTVARDAALTGHIGTNLDLLTRHEGKFGCYAIYRRGV